jgi:amino acid transporter
MPMANRTQPPAAAEVVPTKAGGLGTFGGVFTPSILTILGVIMYLRFGWVLGHVGLPGTLLIVTLSTAITFLTALSVAEIATDQRVRIGGAYYMVSRSIGVETGGAVGIPLFFAQALSVALYTVGFAESVARTFPLNEKFVGLVTTVLVAALAIRSARVAIRAQYIIMAAIGLSLLSLLLGGPIEETGAEIWHTSVELSPGFWAVFAVFFPAVTGIMAGVNMSGDLKNPSRSIPLGTLAAVGTGYLIYMALPVILASRASSEALIADPLIMRRMALWGNAIMLGVWGATLSSAVGSILGAPRVLQALARDGVLPRRLRWLGAGHGPDEEPRNGTIVTLGIALAAVYMGNLNVIAPILTMFFLTTYGALNLAAGIERFLASPSFRPKFRVHWALSLAGAVGCIAVMFLINAMATLAAAVIVVGIFVWLQRREMRTAWGDVRRGIWMALTRAGLLRIDSPTDTRNWRPHILVLSGAPTTRWHLIDLASSLTHNRGLLTVSTVLGEESVTHDRLYDMEDTIREYMLRRGVPSLVRVVTAPDPFSGAEQLVSAYGLGSVTPNTVLLGDSEKAEHRAAYCEMIAHFHEAQRNVIIVHDDPQRGFGRRRQIDVWWGGLKRNGGLMMLLAYLLRSSVEWRNADVYLKMAVPTEEAASGVSANVSQLIARSRTGLELEVVITGDRTFDQVLLDSSQRADLVMIGIAEPRDDFVHYYERLQRRAAGLPTTLYVLAAEDLEFGEVLVDRTAP